MKPVVPRGMRQVEFPGGTDDEACLPEPVDIVENLAIFLLAMHQQSEREELASLDEFYQRLPVRLLDPYLPPGLEVQMAFHKNRQDPLIDIAAAELKPTVRRRFGKKQRCQL